MNSSAYRKSGTIPKNAQINIKKEDKNTGLTKATKAEIKRQSSKKCSSPAKRHHDKSSHEDEVIEYANLPGGCYIGGTPERYRLY